jgi:hypothetical protein
MFDVLSKRSSAVLAVAVFMLAGCAGPLDLLLGGIAESQMTPEGIGATAATYRGYDCDFLARNIQAFEQQMTTDTDKRIDKRIWKWHIDAMNQVRAEKNCAASGVASTVISPGRPAAGQAVIGVRMEPVTSSLATALGLSSIKGALVIETVKGMPAEKAGIKPMDVILEIDGQSIGSPQETVGAVSRIRVGTKTKVQVWRDRHLKTFMVNVVSSSQTSAAPAATKASAKSLVTTFAATGPVVYSYCFYTDVATRRHWTSNVFDVISTPGVDQTQPMGNAFYQFLNTQNKLNANEQAYCPIYDTRMQAENEWNKTRKLYRFATVQNNEVVWAPTK